MIAVAENLKYFMVPESKKILKNDRNTLKRHQNKLE
jgi:hypothetical protein